MTACLTLTPGPFVSYQMFDTWITDYNLILRLVTKLSKFLMQKLWDRVSLPLTFFNFLK